MGSQSLELLPGSSARTGGEMCFRIKSLFKLIYDDSDIMS